ncbi:hypothetical protein G4B88_001810 [Cannabis sativa]|uniref:glutathione transferase n=1 Tax=Cannabis sativa TaxID=3483 RepID=A0A7J6I2J0_CANSA|nr:hypothetical protein G4B88_001810 [Cannabis sativa]
MIKEVSPSKEELIALFKSRDIGKFNRFGICLIDELWTARNRAFHDRVNPSWRGVLARVQGAASCLLTAWDTRPNSEVIQHAHKEIYLGKLVLFVDAAFKELRVAAGIVVSESEGSFSDALAVNFDANQPLEAESWAVFHAFRWCQTRGWRQVVIVSDCQLLVQGLQARMAPDWRLTGVFWSMLELLDDLPEVEVVWMPRSRNQIQNTGDFVSNNIKIMGEEVKLYGARGSPFSDRVNIALKLKGVEYKYFEENYLNNKSTSLLKYNPIHKKVPTFVHNEKPIAESLVIFEYIDETWKTHPILPQHPYERAQARFWSYFIDDKIVPTTLKVVKAKEERKNTLEELSEYLEMLEKELKDKYVGGEGIGMVDIAGNFIAQWIPTTKELVGVDILTEAKFPKLYQWSWDFATHPAIKEVSPSKEEIIAIFKPRLNATN